MQADLIATAMPVATAEENFMLRCRYCNANLKELEHYSAQTKDGSIQRSLYPMPCSLGVTIGVSDVVINHCLISVLITIIILWFQSVIFIDPDKLKDPARLLLEIMPSRLKGDSIEKHWKKILLSDLTSAL